MTPPGPFDIGRRWILPAQVLLGRQALHPIALKIGAGIILEKTRLPYHISTYGVIIALPSNPGQRDDCELMLFKPSITPLTSSSFDTGLVR
jgi:hypothetical protein